MTSLGSVEASSPNCVTKGHELQTTKDNKLNLVNVDLNAV